MCNSVIYPIFSHMLGYTKQQLHHKCHLMTIGVQVRLLLSWHEYVQQCYEVHAMLHNGLQVDYSVHKMTLAIIMLKNIFLLHTKM